MSVGGAKRVARSASVVIPGPAGDLEGVVDSDGSAARAIAVLCHPHPQQQGTMQNKVVTTLARSFVHLGATSVRFNFRGVGRSAGSYADGNGEREDARAVVRWSRERWPDRPLYLAGFSFGAAVVLAIANEVEPAGLVTVAPPIARLPPDFIPPRCRWLLLHGSADDVVPPEPVMQWLETLECRPQIVLLDGVGHFFHGRLGALAEAVAAFFGAELAADEPHTAE